MKPTSISRSSAKVLLLLVGFVLAIGLRVAIGGPGITQSALAGLVFAAALVALGIAAHAKLATSKRAIIGLAGGLALCIPALVSRLIHGATQVSSSGYLVWAFIVTTVAVAEEYFLRGALFDAAEKWHGEVFAVALGASAFAILHIPLYGWHVVPLDLAVGLWLGALRVVSRTWTAPAIAHSTADLLSWWLR